jgi:hypothetical protein
MIITLTGSKYRTYDKVYINIDKLESFFKEDKEETTVVTHNTIFYVIDTVDDIIRKINKCDPANPLVRE